MSAPVPPLRPRPLLTMKDMGMDMGGMDHSGMAGMDMPNAPNPAAVRGVDPSAEQNASRNLWKLTGWTRASDHGCWRRHGRMASWQQRPAMAGMDHAAMGHGTAAAAPPLAAAHGAMAGMDHGSGACCLGLAASVARAWIMAQ